MPTRDSALHGIGLRLLAAFLITAMSAAVHQAAKSAEIGQIMFWRSAIALIPILAYMALRGDLPAALFTQRPRLHIIRGGFGAFSMALSFISLAYLPVATAQALAFLAPVFVLPLAARQLRETIAPALWVAVLLGFAGVIILLWQALSLPGPAGWIGVAAGLTYAITMAFVRVHTKHMTATEKPATIALYFALVSTCIGLITLPFGWTAMDQPGMVWLILAGLLGGGAHIASTEAVARAPISLLAPFDFTSLIWAVGIDLVVFAHMPGPSGAIGMAVIALAALIVTVRRR